MNSLFHRCWAETIGTYFLVLIGCGSAVVCELRPEISPLIIPLCFGGVVSVMIYAVGHLSGAHFNPAVTIAFAIARRCSPKDVAAYIFSQIVGATLAAASLGFFFGFMTHDFGLTQTHLRESTGFAFEALISFLLMFVIISVATDSRAKGEMAGLAIGTTIAICAAFGGPITGASMNPARSLGPALLAWNFHQLWIYLVAPVIGAIAGALTYESLRGRPDLPLS